MGEVEGGGGVSGGGGGGKKVEGSGGVGHLDVSPADPLYGSKVIVFHAYCNITLLNTVCRLSLSLGIGEKK